MNQLAYKYRGTSKVWVVVILLAAIAAAVWVGLKTTGDSEAGYDEEKQAIRQGLDKQILGDGHRVGEFTEFEPEGEGFRFAAPILDRGGSEVGTLTGTLSVTESDGQTERRLDIDAEYEMQVE